MEMMLHTRLGLPAFEKNLMSRQLDEDLVLLVVVFPLGDFAEAILTCLSLCRRGLVPRGDTRVPAREVLLGASGSVVGVGLSERDAPPGRLVPGDKNILVRKSNRNKPSSEQCIWAF